MKKNLTKKLMLSVLTLAFAVVSLGASTFAWFTMSGTADVEGFKGSVVSSEGIEIGYSAIGAAASEITWKTGSITANEIKELIAEINTNDKNGAWSFNAVTPKSLEFAGNGDTEKAYTFEDVDKKTAKGTYVGFSLHFQLSDNTTGKTYPVNMTQLTLSSSGAAEWNCDTEIIYTKEGHKTEVGKKYTYDVLSATRLAIIGNDSHNYYYAPTSDQVAQGAVHTDGLAGYNFTDEESNQHTNVAMGALELYNRRMNKTLSAPKEEKAEFVKLPETQEVTKTDGTKVTVLKTAQQIGELQRDEVITLNVYLWIEGWDAECLNTLFTQELTLDLGFELVIPTSQN